MARQLTWKHQNYELLEDLVYYSEKLGDNATAKAGTIIHPTGNHDYKVGDEFIVNDEKIWIVDAHEIIEEV